MPSRIPISNWRKQQVLRWIESEGGQVPTRAIRHFRAQGLKLDGGSVRRWWRDREKLLAADPSMRRLPGGGRRPLSAAMEDALYDEIVAKRLRKEKVTRAWIDHMARVIYASHHDDDAVFGGFAASPHWITGFMRRYGLSLRRRTNLTTLTDETLVERAVSYMKFLRSAVPAMDLNRTILMDETAVYFEDARNQTVDITGSRHVVPRAWVDSTLLKRWIDLAFPLVDMREGKHLVWDSMRAHISKDVKAKCATRKINMCGIPGGLTPYLQAGDIGIYKTFKDLLYM
ncbi:Pogo transposable element with KRAB [Phytophthora cinnamomi]|uniref:Pogo transposable element with KRAB n=1 Tax=Phytophthora cinnamomi TaxID=4785 RepID=UPI00355A573E|nr:Pogo transposable element with KRAB [Phytophthora cinnamomi]